MTRAFFLFSLLVFSAIGCRSPQLASTPQTFTPEYSIIYMIHGDANYLYHNSDGESLQADEQILEEAKQVARQATNSEVFIFHQKPETNILWVFPKKDRQFLHYKNGKLVHKQQYSPRSATDVFAAEEQLFHSYSNIDSSHNRQRIFLYFGHEIPDNRTRTYHASRPKAQLNTQLFAKGVASFLKAGKFDLTVLSTCNNGTPSMVGKLAPHTRNVLASPKNLHLSHVDTEALPELLKKPDLTSADIADSLAKNTYRRLSTFLQTGITLSLYKTDEMKNYLPSLAKQYNQYLTTLDQTTYGLENNDCKSLPFFDTANDTAGIKMWYRAPRFGQKANANSFETGWGCKMTQN